MRLTESKLKRMIAEEMHALKRQNQRRRRRRLQEGTASNPVRITPEYLNRIIKEEYAAFARKQRLAEARRRRLAEARRRRRSRR
jgi:hypothetical protein